MIHINSVSNTQIINSKYQPDCEVLGDIKHTLKALSLDVETPKQPPIISKIQERYNEIYYPKNSINNTQLHLLQIIKCINEYLDEGILIADIGYYSDPKSFVNFLLPPLTKGRAGVG